MSVRTEPEPRYRKYEERHGPPPHAPAHGYRKKYSFRYYPSSHVYYDSNRKLYFYLENGKWQFGVSLPSSIHLKIGEAVAIEMGADMPYVEFETHKAKYPPKYKKKGKGKGKWKK